MGIDVHPTTIPDVLLISPNKVADRRGYFCELYRDCTIVAQGEPLNFVQENLSLSKHPGTIRGLHFQTPPCAQAKLVRATRGRILDIAVDIRRSSPTFGRHVVAELSSESLQQIFIPAGFAHGFCTLEPNTEVVYKVTNYYAPESDRGLLWNDPDLNIAWPRSWDVIELSDKDRCHPRLRDLPNYFE
jgi:dTDP-4-dehydrorhamnose 3,5-epimerase